MTKREENAFIHLQDKVFEIFGVKSILKMPFPCLTIGYYFFFSSDYGGLFTRNSEYQLNFCSHKIIKNES